MYFSELKSCPRCGEEEYYTKDYIHGSSKFYRCFNGEEAENGALYDNTSVESGRIAYCAGCDMRLGNLLDDTLSKQAEKELKRRSKDEI